MSFITVEVTAKNKPCVSYWNDENDFINYVNEVFDVCFENFDDAIEIFKEDLNRLDVLDNQTDIMEYANDWGCVYAQDMVKEWAGKHIELIGK